MNMKEEMMNDMMDDAMGDVDDEDESEVVVNKGGYYMPYFGGPISDQIEGLSYSAKSIENNKCYHISKK